MPPSIDINKNPIPETSIYALLSGQQALVKPSSDAWYLFDAKKRLKVGPVSTRQEALGSKALRAALRAGDQAGRRALRKLFGTPPKTVLVSCGVADGFCPGVNSSAVTQSYYYLLKHDPPNVPEMTGTDLKLSGTRQDFDTTPGAAGEPIVLLSFTNHGRKKFEEITRAEAQRGKQLTSLIGQGQTITQHFAIVLDREIKSWPQIDWTQYPNGISGSSGAQISGSFSVKEAKDLALVLQTGALPVKFVTLDQTAISATLGKDSLKEAKRAALVGLLIVALFLVVFYRFLGVVAVLGLGVYAAFLYAAILLFNVTLTLPGFAGLVLTLGVAADANVVIFERVKEESRAGHSMRRAIAQGYGRGFHTIIDANVVTAITAFVLFAFATATVKGFALMLLIGTAISMLTAVVFTRALLSVLAGFPWIENAALMGATGGGIPDWLKIDFIGKRQALVRHLRRSRRDLDRRAANGVPRGSTSASTSTAARRSRSRHPHRCRSSASAPKRRGSAVPMPSSRAEAPPRAPTATRASRCGHARSRPSSRSSSRTRCRRRSARGPSGRRASRRASAGRSPARRAGQSWSRCS